ncbi:hypothetical protein LCGC14_1408260 [marine sediment metagenome]|uniref:HNH nuclease domain-containing protein n=1 Tax=marine sediment metagenome TaxID=412755 RepID=A0A0F9MAB5_9ZZZZ
MKTCTKCKQLVSKDRFTKCKRNKDRLNYWCRDCCKVYVQNNIIRIKKYRKENYQANIVQKREYGRKYYQIHPDQMRRYRLQYNLDNVEPIKMQRRNSKKRKVYMLRYSQENRPKLNAWAAKRRAALLQRTPRWLTPEQLQQIENFYINCPKGMTVDHIIPLQGEYVSGLHHPDNLQYLSPKENSIKGHRCLGIDGRFDFEVENKC